MALIKLNDIGGYTVSTITLDDVPYPLSHGNKYETAVFSNMGKVLHTEQVETVEDAVSNHDRVVAEILASTFEGNGEDWYTLKSK